jgi:hypothetical protein
VALVAIGHVHVGGLAESVNIHPFEVGQLQVLVLPSHMKLGRHWQAPATLGSIIPVP